jgi:PST family polysaccharide transporter
VLDANNLGSRVVSGASFTLLNIMLRTLLTIGSMSVLARLLTPADFGYLAMATMVTEFAALLGSFGFSNILIQHRTINRLQLDTIFWAAFGVGCFIAVLVFALSFSAEKIFDDARVGELLRVLCVNFIFTSSTSVHEALLARLMRFRTDFAIQISAIFLRASIAIICALLGLGVWSLVVGSISGTFAVMVMMRVVMRYLPRWRFNARYLRSILKTSSSYLGDTSLHYLNMNVDLFMIGRQFGPSALGYYQNARSLTDEVRGRLAMPLQRVLFPAFSSIQEDRSRLQDSVLRSARLLAAIICPVGFGISAVAPEIVPVLYGEQWLAMIPLLSVLGISAALRAATAISFPLFNSQNRVGLSFRCNVFGTAILLTSIVLAIPYGLTAVAGTISANALFSVLVFWVSLRLIGLGVHAVLHVLLRPVLASLLMWGAIIFLRAQLPAEGLNIVFRLLLMVFSGMIAYCSVLVALSRQYVVDFTDLAHKLLHRR